ncbi:hypothetical protein WMO28_03445 [Blautia sp. CLA-JM-H16]|uniref:Rpn family recombination-promoting nuclease/putative transposase n=1 Tax=Blautia aquisgranensis TaxID=3133153 RepID=A0ABV1BBI9_9FIRM
MAKRKNLALRKNKSEVIAMSIFEYDKEEEERKLRKAEYEAGREEGIKEGTRGIVRNMLQAGEPMEKIARYTGCTVQELERFAAELHRK